MLLNKLPHLDVVVFEAMHWCGGCVENPIGIVTYEPHAHCYRRILPKSDFWTCPWMYLDIRLRMLFLLVHSVSSHREHLNISTLFHAPLYHLPSKDGGYWINPVELYFLALLPLRPDLPLHITVSAAFLIGPSVIKTQHYIVPAEAPAFNPYRFGVPHRWTHTYSIKATRALIWFDFKLSLTYCTKLPLAQFLATFIIYCPVDCLPPSSFLCPVLSLEAINPLS